MELSPEHQVVSMGGGEDPYPNAGENAHPAVQEIIQEYKALPLGQRERPLLYHLLGGGTPAYKTSKSEAEYLEEPRADQKCGNCQFAYQKVVTGKFICSKIRGKITPEAWCKFWKGE